MSGQHCCMEPRRGPLAKCHSIRNVDPEAHAANKLDKTHHERGSDSYHRYQKVAVWNCKELKAVFFRACHETWLPAKRSTGGHGRGQARKREAKTAMGWQHNQMDGLHLREGQGSCQERMRLRFLTGNVNRHATWLVTDDVRFVFIYKQYVQ